MKKTAIFILTAMVVILACSCTKTDTGNASSQESASSTESILQSEHTDKNTGTEKADEKSDTEQAAANRTPSYSTTQPSLEILPNVDGFEKKYADSDNGLCIVYVSSNHALTSISFYIMPATADVIDEMTTKDLTAFNRYRETLLTNGSGIVLSEGVFEQIGGRTVLTFSITSGNPPSTVYEYHYLDGENLIILLASSLSEDVPANILEDAVNTIIAY